MRFNVQNIFGGRGGMNVKNQGRRLKKMKAGGPLSSLADLTPVKKNTGVEAWVAWYQHSSRAKEPLRGPAVSYGPCSRSSMLGSPFHVPGKVSLIVTAYKSLG